MLMHKTRQRLAKLPLPAPAPEFKNGAEQPPEIKQGGWVPIIEFVLICWGAGGALAILDWRLSKTWVEHSDAFENARILIFAAGVIWFAFKFPKLLGGPLEKSRVDALYYSVVVLSAAILYIDNIDKRLETARVTKAEVAQLQMRRTLSSIEAAKEELASADAKLAALKAQRSLIILSPAEQTSVIQQIKVLAKDRLDRHNLECPIHFNLGRERYCERDVGAPYGWPLNDFNKRIPDVRRPDPYSMECIRYRGCQLTIGSGVPQRWEKLAAATHPSDFIAIGSKDVDLSPETVRTSSGGLDVMDAIAVLRMAAGDAGPLSMLEQDLTAASTAAEASLARGQADADELQADIDAAKLPAPKSPSSLVTGVLARFVWSHVLITLLGLKIARERFLWWKRSREVVAPSTPSPEELVARREDRVRAAAYLRYERRTNRPPPEVEDWLEAERLVAEAEKKAP
ncbi:DUF2934 domain-containing protein [Variovorax guangxiensis]|uniref:DUF2934 domain-containing protein n=1 Tax=Variovorax guangxiensis TaxID=1775474 RepID=UPI00286C5976|nr:DUF2934 domain-containing protein [Variovorax guangxiensis]